MSELDEKTLVSDRQHFMFDRSQTESNAGERPTSSLFKKRFNNHRPRYMEHTKSSKHLNRKRLSNFQLVEQARNLEYIQQVMMSEQNKTEPTSNPGREKKVGNKISEMFKNTSIIERSKKAQTSRMNTERTQVVLPPQAQYATRELYGRLIRPELTSRSEMNLTVREVNATVPIPFGTSVGRNNEGSKSQHGPTQHGAYLKNFKITTTIQPTQIMADVFTKKRNSNSIYNNQVTLNNDSIENNIAAESTLRKSTKSSMHWNIESVEEYNQLKKKKRNAFLKESEKERMKIAEFMLLPTKFLLLREVNIEKELKTYLDSGTIEAEVKKQDSNIETRKAYKKDERRSQYERNKSSTGGIRRDTEGTRPEHKTSVNLSTYPDLDNPTYRNTLNSKQELMSELQLGETNCTDAAVGYLAQLNNKIKKLRDKVTQEQNHQIEREKEVVERMLSKLQPIHEAPMKYELPHGYFYKSDIMTAAGAVKESMNSLMRRRINALKDKESVEMHIYEEAAKNISPIIEDVNKYIKTEKDRGGFKEKKVKILRSLLELLRRLNKLNISIDEFIAKRPFPDQPFEMKGSVEFLQLAKDGDTYKMKKILQNNKFLVYQYDSLKQTALHLAAKRGHAGTVEMLLQHCADPDFKDAVDKTALFYAIHSNNYLAVTSLIRAGAQVWGLSDNNSYHEKYRLERFHCLKIVDEVRKIKIASIFSTASNKKKEELIRRMIDRALEESDRFYFKEREEAQRAALLGTK